jgi:uncharacterized protein (DUF1684 family)
MDVREVEDLRQHKDRMFRDDPHSPLPPDQRARFAGLRYFFPPQLLLQLLVEPADGSTLETRPRTVRPAVSVGPVGCASRSTVSRPSWSCFLPFRDVTSGKESYGAGRYLDVEPGRDGRVQGDFNLAYNPYCAYNDAFSCPLPHAGELAACADPVR